MPLHGAGLLRGDRGLIACAQSGGGKTSFTVAMVRRGWRALGDDKLLLGAMSGTPVMVGLAQTLNLDPGAGAWFPEIGDLSAQAAYSSFTEKRRVSIERMWPGRVASQACPTDLVFLDRPVGHRGITIRPLTQVESSSLLLRQTVIPNDRALARDIIGCLWRVSARCRGWQVDVGHDAYLAADALDAVDAVLL